MVGHVKYFGGTRVQRFATQFGEETRMSRRITSIVVVLTLLGLSAHGPALAQVSWDGGGGVGNTNWSNNSNWNPDGSPSAQNVTFDNTAAAGTAGTVDNVVDANFTINSLTYSNSGATNFHT